MLPPDVADRTEVHVKKTAMLAAIILPLAATTALAAEPDPALAQFRAAYTSGDGIAYVVIPDEKGERIYRYGDASRVTAKKDPRGYMLFTCAAPHVFVQEKAEDKAALQKAKVVKASDPGFAELDAEVPGGLQEPAGQVGHPEEEIGLSGAGYGAPHRWNGAHSTVVSARIGPRKFDRRRARAIRLGSSHAARCPQCLPPAPAKLLQGSRDARHRKTGSGAVGSR